MTIYHVAEMLGTAFPKAFTPENIVAGFRCTGVHPFDENIFTEEDFLGSFVTDRPMTSAVADTPDPLPVEQASVSSTEVNQAHPSPTPAATNTPPSLTVQQERVTPPEEIRPFPKAPPRKTQGGRKKGKTAILTSTPAREELLSTKEKGSKKPAKRARKRLQTPPPDSDEEDIAENMLVQEDSDTPDEEDESLTESFSFKDIKIDDYVLVKYGGLRTPKYFAGKVFEIDQSDDRNVRDYIPCKTTLQTCRPTSVCISRPRRH
jgi:hypothetical protein